MLARPSFREGLMISDAVSSINISFMISGSSDQVTGHHIQCIDNITGEIEHEHKAMSFLLSCNIDANTLLNGKEYRVRVRTYNSNIATDFSNENNNTTSEWSDYMILKCFTKAEVAIINIPIDTTGNRLIKNQTFTFEGNYSQKESVGLKSFRYILYDKDKVVLQSYPEVYQLDGALKQEVTGIVSDKEYYIELVTLNQYEIETRSELIDFRVDYSPPRITQVLQVSNDEENALVKIDAQVVQMLLQGNGEYSFENYATYLRNKMISEVSALSIGEVTDQSLTNFTKERITQPLGTYTTDSYETNDLYTSYSITTDPATIQDVFFINLESPDSKVWIDDGRGLNMEYMYTMHIWAENILEDKEFITISGKNSSLTMFITGDGNLHCVETYGNIKRHTRAKITDYIKDRGIHIFLQKRDTYIRVIAKGVIN